MHTNALQTLVAQRELTSDSDLPFQMKYYRTQKPSNDAPSQQIYGVCLEKYEPRKVINTMENNSTEEKFENKPSECQNIYVTDNKEQIDKILDALIEKAVTVRTVEDVLDCIYDTTS